MSTELPSQQENESQPPNTEQRLLQFAHLLGVKETPSMTTAKDKLKETIDPLKKINLIIAYQKGVETQVTNEPTSEIGCEILRAVICLSADLPQDGWYSLQDARQLATQLNIEQRQQYVDYIKQELTQLEDRMIEYNIPRPQLPTYINEV